MSSQQRRQIVDERARHDQIAENCAADKSEVFVSLDASSTEVDADGLAVGKTQVDNQPTDLTSIVCVAVRTQEDSP